MKWPANSATGEYLDIAAAQAWAKSVGIANRPAPPRNLQFQSAARGGLVTWDAPIASSPIVGYKIYTVKENQLLDTIYDPNVRQYKVPANAGASPPANNIFISAVSKRSESVKIQIQGSALTESGAPSDPSPPAGSAATGTGDTFGIDGSADAPPELSLL